MKIYNKHFEFYGRFREHFRRALCCEKLFLSPAINKKLLITKGAPKFNDARPVQRSDPFRNVLSTFNG